MDEDKMKAYWWLCVCLFLALMFDKVIVNRYMAKLTSSSVDYPTWVINVDSSLVQGYPRFST